LTPTLDWNDVPGATSYDVEVCSKNTCSPSSAVVRSATLTSSQWTVTSALGPCKDYWWRIRAKNSCGDSPWSTIRKFTTTCGSPRIDIGSASGLKGTTVSVPITLTNVPGTSIASIGIDIGYDTVLLGNPTCQTGPAGNAVGKSATCSTPSSGVLRIAIAGLNNTAIGNGIVAYAKFTIKVTAPPGATQLNNTPSAADTNANPVTVGGSNGSIIILSKCGDCNGDNACSIAEVQSVINCFLGLKVVDACLDCNGDGSCTIDEVQKVINCYLGL
jgi:hypothetical protein